MTSYPMHAVRGMTFHLWLRARWSILMILAALAIAAIIGRIWPHEQWLVFAGVMSGAAVAIAMAHLAGVFTFADRDLGAPESGFPKYMFVLPARPAALAAVPMLFGAALCVAVWALLAKIVVDPMILWEQKLVVSALWPGFMLAAAISTRSGRAME